MIEEVPDVPHAEPGENAQEKEKSEQNDGQSAAAQDATAVTEGPVGQPSASPNRMRDGGIPARISPEGPGDAPAWNPVTIAFMQVWTSIWGEVLGQIAGGGVDCDLSGATPDQTLAPTETDWLTVVVIAGALRGEMSFRISQAGALRLTRLLLGESEAESAEFNAERREAFEELLRQISGQAATALKARWGEVQLRWQTAGPPGWASAAAGWFVVRSKSGWSVAVEWQLSAALHAALIEAAKTTGDSPASTGESFPDKKRAASPQLLPAEQLDLILDVELALTLRFGAKSLLLQDILQLNAGSVVELDRQVEDPVELLLDGRLIARGEVVVVDGNYGLRVHEVFSSSGGT